MTALTTVPVQVTAKRADGTPVANAKVRFVLTRPDVDGQVVVPSLFTGTTDVDGEATVSAWPNARGVNGSQYQVEIRGDGVNFSGLATVPDSACNLHEILQLQAPATLDDAMRAALDAQAAVAQARSVSGALLYTFDGATADADPGAGELRLNHATLASATAAYVDNLEQGGADVSAVLDCLDDSTSPIKCALVLREGRTGKVAVYRVTGPVVDGAGYRKLTLTWVGGSAGGFTDGNSVGFTFSITGEPGGAAGSNTQVLFNDGGSSAGNANLTYDKATSTLTAGRLAAPAHAFPATQIPSGDPNTLDDYEEGTYTPSLLFGGGETGMAYSSRSGSYTKIGRVVHFRAALTLSAVGTDSGGAMVSLPFAPAASNNDTAVTIRAASLTAVGGALQAHIQAASSLVMIEWFAAGNAIAFGKAQFQVGSTLHVSGFYFV